MRPKTKHLIINWFKAAKTRVMTAYNLFLWTNPFSIYFFLRTHLLLVYHPFTHRWNISFSLLTNIATQIPLSYRGRQYSPIARSLMATEFFCMFFSRLSWRFHYTEYFEGRTTSVCPDGYFCGLSNHIQLCCNKCKKLWNAGGKSTFSRDVNRETATSWTWSVGSLARRIPVGSSQIIQSSSDSSTSSADGNI